MVEKKGVLILQYEGGTEDRAILESLVFWLDAANIVDFLFYLPDHVSGLNIARKVCAFLRFDDD